MSSQRQSRSLRKRTKPARYADDIDDLESMLKEHEQKGVEERAAKNKRLKTPEDEKEEDPYADAFKGYDIPFDAMPDLCIERIFGMLDSPQDLYNLAFISKRLMNLVSPTIVIRSAVFNNLRKRDKGNRKIMSNIMGYINNRSIHVPSPHRMLRLLNAKSCERGDRCWGKNLNTGKPMALIRNSCSRPFGLALCDKCIKFGTTKVPYSHFSRFQNGVAFYNWNLLMNPQRNPKNGEVDGPLLEVLELQQIENSYTNNDDKKSALEGTVAQAHTNDGKYCPAHYEEKAASYQEIYENAEKEADDTVAAALEKDQQMYRERREERIAKRMTRIRSIYASLEDIMGDCPLKELALECTWLESDERCVKFSCHIVEQTMSSIISAPASASERSINNAADSIKQIFNTLHEKEFFTFSFIENSNNRLRRGMHEYCVNETSPIKIMQSSMSGDVHFMQALQEDKPIRALVRALNRMRGALPRIFALSVVMDNPEVGEIEESRVDDLRKLAEVVWSKKSPAQYGSEIMSFNTTKETFNTSVEEFRIMKKNAKDYLQDDRTRRFLLRDNVNQGNDDFDRQDAINQVFQPKTHTIWLNGIRSSAYDHIRNRNFESLINLHEQYFRRPQHFSVR